METINFTRGVPANESFPLDEVIEAAGAALRERGAAMLQYGPSPGFSRCANGWRKWQGVGRAGADRQRLAAADRVPVPGLLKPGDVVLTESPTYDRTITLLRRHGTRVVGVPSRPTVRTSPRSSGRSSGEPGLFYAIPDFQNPSGATCSGEKRRRWRSWPSATASCWSRTPVSPAALSRRGGADALRARARAHAAHELVHQADRPRRATGFMVGGPA